MPDQADVPQMGSEEHLKQIRRWIEGGAAALPPAFKDQAEGIRRIHFSGAGWIIPSLVKESSTSPLTGPNAGVTGTVLTDVNMAHVVYHGRHVRIGGV